MPAIVRSVKFSLILPLCGVFALLPGCATRYTKFRATNPRGELIADWTARGSFYPVSGGYRINAVERISGPPLVHESHYPHGWKTAVTGAHIERWRTNEPAWMSELDHPVEVTTEVNRRERLSYLPKN